MKRPPLSQHFLQDRGVIRSILNAAELQGDETALEIGPGRGILTAELLTSVQNLVAVELDRELATQLQLRFGRSPAWTLVQGDFLKQDLNQLFPTASAENPIKVLGNLPYAVTSPIMEKVLSWPGWNTAVFLIQREVGERIRSQPGSKTFGILSLAVQLFAEVEKIGLVKPGAFRPPPQVVSMIIRLRRRTDLALPDADIPAFFDLAHGAFAHRRKTLANSLAFFTEKPRSGIEKWLKTLDVDPSRRAETLGLQEYVRLARPWAIFRRENELT